MRDITQQRFGRLIAVSLSGKIASDFFWHCNCDCGKTSIVSCQNLLSGNTLSCGCLKAQLQSIRFSTHGMSKTVTYSRWQSMLKRCYDMYNISYANYGGRGISVCRRWRHSFHLFFQDMGVCPSTQYSLDRINANKNYSPKNCRWVLKAKQAQNRRDSVFIHWNGRKECLTEWARIVGVNSKTIRTRFESGLRPPQLFKAAGSLE